MEEANKEKRLHSHQIAAIHASFDAIDECQQRQLVLLKKIQHDLNDQMQQFQATMDVFVSTVKTHLSKIPPLLELPPPSQGLKKKHSTPVLQRETIISVPPSADQSQTQTRSQSHSESDIQPGFLARNSSHCGSHGGSTKAKNTDPPVLSVPKTEIAPVSPIVMNFELATTLPVPSQTRQELLPVTTTVPEPVIQTQTQTHSPQKLLVKIKQEPGLPEIENSQLPTVEGESVELPFPSALPKSLALLWNEWESKGLDMYRCKCTGRLKWPRNAQIGFYRRVYLVDEIAKRAQQYGITQAEAAKRMDGPSRIGADGQHELNRDKLSVYQYWAQLRDADDTIVRRRRRCDQEPDLRESLREIRQKIQHGERGHHTWNASKTSASTMDNGRPDARAQLPRHNYHCVFCSSKR